jgi:hypothetical protein
MVFVYEDPCVENTIRYSCVSEDIKFQCLCFREAKYLVGSRRRMTLCHVVFLLLFTTYYLRAAHGQCLFSTYSAFAIRAHNRYLAKHDTATSRRKIGGSLILVIKKSKRPASASIPLGEVGTGPFLSGTGCNIIETWKS